MIATQQLGMTGRGRAGLANLDAYSTGRWNVCGLQKLISTYTGAAIRVRRSSDNTEQDINFAGWFIDIAALLSFAGAGDAFVTKIYDQTGNGRYMGQAASSKQPRVVSSAVFDGVIRFDGVDDHMESNGASGGANSGFTIYTRMALRDTSAVYVMFELSSNYNSFKAPLVVYDSTFQLSTHNGSGGIYCVRSHNAGLYPNERPSAFRFDTTQAANNENRWFAAGTEIIAATNPHVGSGDTSGNFAAQPWNIGNRNGGTAPTPMNLSYLAIYETAHSDTTIKTIHAEM